MSEIVRPNIVRPTYGSVEASRVASLNAAAKKNAPAMLGKRIGIGGTALGGNMVNSPQANTGMMGHVFNRNAATPVQQAAPTPVTASPPMAGLFASRMPANNPPVQAVAPVSSNAEYAAAWNSGDYSKSIARPVTALPIAPVITK